jgi:hypothetical protein
MIHVVLEDLAREETLEVKIGIYLRVLTLRQ